jgi:transcriptional regulator with XRE-family HTH domain
MSSPYLRYYAYDHRAQADGYWRGPLTVRLRYRHSTWRYGLVTLAASSSTEGIGMAAVQKWSGREARALREAQRMTIRTFAAYLGVNERTITKWEAGGTAHIPRPELQAALDTALSGASAEVRQRFMQAFDSGEAKAAEPSTSPRLQASFDDAAVAELRERLASAAAVDADALALLAMQAEHIRTLDRMLGARAAEAQLTGHLATLSALRSFTIVPGQREALADLFADAAALAGWQALDLGKVTDSWQRYEAAKDAGREGRSPAALVHAMAEQAYVLIELDEASAALQLAEHARSAASDTVPHLLLAWLWAVEGEAHAVLGHERACRRAFETAEQHLPLGRRLKRASSLPKRNGWPYASAPPANAAASGASSQL